MINLKPNLVNFVFCELLYVFCTWAKTLSCVTDRRKKNGVVGRSENSGERQSFRSHMTHKGQPKSRSPRKLDPDLQPTQDTCKEEKKIRENKEDSENPTKLRRGQTLRNRRINLHNKSNPRAFCTHQR